MARGQIRSTEEKVSAIQAKIDAHKKHIDNLEKQKTTLMKEINSKAASELIAFIEKKHLTVNDAKRLINQSIKPVKASNSENRQNA